MMLRPLLYLRSMFAGSGRRGAEQLLLMLLHLLFEEGRLCAAENRVSFGSLEAVCGVAAHIDLIQYNASLGVERHGGLGAR